MNFTRTYTRTLFYFEPTESHPLLKYSRKSHESNLKVNGSGLITAFGHLQNGVFDNLQNVLAAENNKSPTKAIT